MTLLQRLKRHQSLDSNMDTQTWIHTENSNQHVNTQNEISPQCRSNSNQRNKMTKMRAGQIKASKPSNNILLNLRFILIQDKVLHEEGDHNNSTLILQQLQNRQFYRVRGE